MLAALGVGVLMARSPYDTTGGALVVGLSLAILALLLLPRIGLKGDRRFLLHLLVVALAARTGATLLRIFVNVEVYGGPRDAAAYDSTGTLIASHLRHFDFGAVAPYMHPGTDFAAFYTGVVYAITGPTLYGGFLAFSFLAFLGSLLFYRAFCTAFPNGNRRLFAVLVLLYPSILYWPTGLGKDALMFFFAGMSAYGTALLLVRARWTGVVPLLLGLLGAMSVRPHIAGILALALTVAFVFGRRGHGRSSVPVQVLGLGVSVAAGWFFAVQAASFLGLESLSPSAALDFLSQRSANVFEGEGGTSNFVTTPVTSPLWAPMAFVTVLFRPFPWEAHNVQALVQALDGVLLALLLLWGTRRMWKAATSVGKEAYLLYVLSVMVVLTLALSTLGNFGLLARERAMVLPFLFMAIAFAPSLRPQSSPSPLSKTS